MRRNFFAVTTFSTFAHTFIAIGIAILASGGSQMVKAQPALSVANNQFQVMSRPEASQLLKFYVHLQLHNSAGLDQLIADQGNPNSLNYRQFLTPEQFRERFGPSKSDVNQATAILSKQGLQVTSRTSQSIEVQGNVENIVTSQ